LTVAWENEHWRIVKLLLQKRVQIDIDKELFLLFLFKNHRLPAHQVEIVELLGCKNINGETSLSLALLSKYVEKCCFKMAKRLIEKGVFREIYIKETALPKLTNECVKFLIQQEIQIDLPLYKSKRKFVLDSNKIENEIQFVLNRTNIINQILHNLWIDWDPHVITVIMDFFKIPEIELYKYFNLCRK
jgi:hypothetical protein